MDQSPLVLEQPSPTTISIQLFDQSGKLLQQLLSKQEKEEGIFRMNIPISQIPIGMNYIILQTSERQIARKLVRVR